MVKDNLAEKRNDSIEDVDGIEDGEKVNTTEEMIEEKGLEQDEKKLNEEIETPQTDNDELSTLKKENDELMNRYLRVQADFDNFRKRSRLEKEETIKLANAKLITDLLTVIDNLERALMVNGDDANFQALKQGVEMVYRELKQSLEKAGLKEMDAIGKPFDPNYHQAVMQEEKEGIEPNIVLEELMKGYLLNDKVIRPAMVKVSQ